MAKDLESLYEVAAAELSKSPIFARALADKIAADHELLKQVVTVINPELLATALAEYMVRMGTTNRKYDTDIWDDYRGIVRHAKDKASEILAKEIIARDLKKPKKQTESQKMQSDILHA